MSSRFSRWRRSSPAIAAKISGSCDSMDAGVKISMPQCSSLRGSETLLIGRRAPAPVVDAEGERREPVERRGPMKLACTSGAFHAVIESGGLTQLEFLDFCAREAACDGIVFDVRHFPRTDDEYLAQLKKMATDRGLTVAAVADASFFGAPQDRMAAVLDWAV